MVYDVISHQFKTLNLHFLYPSTPLVQVYRIGSFHIPRQLLLQRFRTALQILRQKRAIPFVYNHAYKFLKTSFPLRHVTQNFNTVAQIRYWTRPDSNATIAAQSAPRHYKDLRYRPRQIYSRLSAAPVSDSALTDLASTVPSAHP